eukprot:745273-Pyramimonas_sp.AAC.1
MEANHLLGVLVDTDLTWRPLLRDLVGKGCSLFGDLFKAAAAQVPSQVASAVVYPAPLLSAVREAE